MPGAPCRLLAAACSWVWGDDGGECAALQQSSCCSCFCVCLVSFSTRAARQRRIRCDELQAARRRGTQRHGRPRRPVDAAAAPAAGGNDARSPCEPSTVTSLRTRGSAPRSVRGSAAESRLRRQGLGAAWAWRAGSATRPIHTDVVALTGAGRSAACGSREPVSRALAAGWLLLDCEQCRDRTAAASKV